jgi:serine/threonine protein kinase
MASVHPVQCSECGETIPSSSIDGFCARCLLESALKAGTRESVPIQGLPGSDPEENEPRYFGNYQILEEIARGGMGVVYKARQLNPNRVVALKMILAGDFASLEAMCRFRAEAEAAATLQHPNIVAIHEVGEHEGQPYFSMEYVEGSNLSALVGEGPMPAIQAARYLQIVSEAIHYAHSRQILHRDLKPSNLLIDHRGQPRITDFGLAKRLDSNSDLTASGQTLGSPAYMSPEQATGRRGSLGPHSDVYSLGGVLYFLLAGRAPFAAETPQMTLNQVIKNQPVPPRILNPGVPRDLETICLKCLEKDLARRYSSAQELAEELGRFLRHEPIRARRSGPLRRSTQWGRRNPVGAVLLLSLSLGLAGALVALHLVNQQHIKQTEILDYMDRQQLKAGLLLSINAQMLVAQLDELWLSAEHRNVPISSEQLGVLSAERPSKMYKGETLRYRFGVNASDRPVRDAQRFAPLLALLEQGLSARLERPVLIDLVIYKFRQDRDQALIDGALDFTSLDPLVYFQLKREHPNLQALAQWDHPPQTAIFFTRPDTGIATLADLKGRRLAFGDLRGFSFQSQLKLSEAGLSGKHLETYEFLDTRDEFSRDIEDLGFDQALEKRRRLHSTADVIEAVIEGRFDAGVTTMRAFEKNKHRGLALISDSKFERLPSLIIARENLSAEMAGYFTETLIKSRNKAFMELLPDRPTGFKEITPSYYPAGSDWLKRIDGLFPVRSTAELMLGPGGGEPPLIPER